MNSHNERPAGSRHTNSPTQSETDAPQSVRASVETWTIPTYESPPPQDMPMFAEFRQHQGTTGNPYPSRIVTHVNHSCKTDRAYTVVVLENTYIRVAVLPEIGGRVFEAYDKVNDYHFLYRQHVIKPALIGCNGLWMSGGMEFNWPFHHRPSTFMPIDYHIDEHDDGSAVVWLSEHDPSERTKGMVGIALRPDAAYFETRVQISNRTPVDHPFMWWENAAVSVHEDYQLVFPPDVTWVHHHYDRSHATYPLAQGQYGAEFHETPADISWHKNTRFANSYFAAPSKLDFFGGYDHRRQCGVLHIANHHLSPGKKMFTWGYGRHAENWEQALTDEDGPYAELMAGSYTDDQPDFAWIAPFETKSFSQYWYPVNQIGPVTYATLNAAFALDRQKNQLRLVSTSRLNHARLTVLAEKSTAKRDSDQETLLDETLSLMPGRCYTCSAALSEQPHTVILTAENGCEILRYTEEKPDLIHIPPDNPGIPAPGHLTSAQDLFIAGQHLDQYRDPIFKPDAYYLEALKKDPAYLPALIGMGEYLYRTGRYDAALSYLNRAQIIENRYNTNPKQGRISYLKGLVYFAADAADQAYDAFYKAAWNADTLAASMTYIAAIDGRRQDFDKMLAHAQKALEKEARHPIAGSYAALAEAKAGYLDQARARLEDILAQDPLDHLAGYLQMRLSDANPASFYQKLKSNPSQTCIDIAFDLVRAGMVKEAASLLEDLSRYSEISTLALYVLADCHARLGQADEAKAYRRQAASQPLVEVFPYRLEEIKVLEQAMLAHAEDGTAAYLLGCLLYDKKQYAKAADLWQKAIKYLPDFYIPYRNLAMVYYSHLDKKQEALPLLTQAIERRPHDEQLLIETSYVMARLGLPGEQRAAFIEDNQPDLPTDALQLELVKALQSAGHYDKALEKLTSHEFSPGEGEEFLYAEQYMFGRQAEGRLLLKQDQPQKALSCFEASLRIPENMHAGFWNISVTVPYRYYAAEALLKLGQTDQANTILKEISGIRNTGMANMGQEFIYYTALATRLSGDTLKARSMIREAMLDWERQLADVNNTIQVPTPFFRCFIEDPAVENEANLHALLGYGMLFWQNKEQARQHFEKSLKLNPDNMKVAFELKQLED